MRGELKLISSAGNQHVKACTQSTRIKKKKIMVTLIGEDLNSPVTSI